MLFLNGLQCALLVITLSSSASVKDYKFEMKTYSSDLTDFVANIILKYVHQTSYAICIVRCSDPAEPSNDDLQSDIINKILHKTHPQVLVQLESPTSIADHPRANRIIRYYNIFFADDYDSFQKIYDRLSSNFFDYSGYYIVILTKAASKLKYDSDIQNILSDFWKLYIVNVNVIVNNFDNSSGVSTFTYFPYAESYCGEVHPQIISNGTITTTFDESFPPKLKNFYQCKLYVASLQYAPFILYRQGRNGTYSVAGIEGNLLRTLSRQLNFRAALRRIHEKWGFIADNGTATGILKMVISGRANFSIGYMRVNPTRNKFMTASNTYFTSQILFVVPPGEPFSSLEKMLFPFKWSSWLSIVLLYLACVVGILVLEKCASRKVRNFVLGRNIHTPNVNLVSIMFGNSVPVLPQRNFARTILVIWILAFLVFRTIYQATMFDVMQDNRNKSVAQNMDEMWIRGYNFYMSNNTVIYLEGNHRMLERTVINNDYDLKEVRRSQIIQNSSTKFAITESAENVAWFNKNNSNQSFQYTAKESVATVNLAIYFKKNSCLISTINEELAKIIPSGLLKFWTVKHVDYNYLIPSKPSSDPQVLTLKELAAPFQILCFGYAIATIVFICELLLNRC